MFAFELQKRIDATGKSVKVYACHPGASRTNLLNDTASRFKKILWRVLSRFIAQSTEKGAWPEVMCATHKNLPAIALYGPTKRMDTVGPVGQCSLDGIALDREEANKLWLISEQKTEFHWDAETVLSESYTSSIK